MFTWGRSPSEPKKEPKPEPSKPKPKPAPPKVAKKPVETQEDRDKKRKELEAKIVKPMGNPRELEETMKEQMERLRETQDGEIIQSVQLK